MKLKVCGMKYEDNIIQVANLQPDYLGFIFYKKSTRHFNTNIPELPESIKKVGVFVNEILEDVIEQINKHQLHAVQLHGKETPEYCQKLKRHYEEQSDVITLSKEADRHAKLVSVSHKKNLKQVRLEIIKVFSIKDEFNFEVIKPYEDVCDYFLFDTKGKLPGGNGYTFDWNVLNQYPSTKPFFLSGGIGLEQVEDIKKFKQSKASKFCYALDVNSKFEIEPGLKSIEKLKEFKKTFVIPHLMRNPL
ncbi:phosphoribosylanthranilate isomerase [Flavivirga rizhaonensis]|uniref:N-(5'-phosphoribosyl)anthranilate isomerase n=1 Tax=Flavivirga rizhaonensis TaxID=2559571 RepID=A0A4S1DTX6_9FLAO|nr:phosphoribosylanthranilate isomerase [Flavivirga rizhaonensis]TGV01255.1 phosphoribosylanthranilate isomerase [Flavivirga rizhaonensis]